MNKKSLLLFGFLVILGISLFFFLRERDVDLEEIETQVETDFTLESRYLGEYNWEYTIEGQFPNPCYGAEVDEIVMESMPEQVTIKLTRIEPDPDVMCAQVIQDYAYTGQFQASEEAQITLQVE